MGARAWPCPGPLWGGQGPAKEGGGRDRWSHSSWGWGKPELALAGPPGGLGRGSCPELSVQGGGREAATRSTPCASPWGRAAQPAGSIQSPPRGMLGEAARIRAAGCALPSPGNRGLKWVKEEGGGPGGLGEGPEALRRHPEGGGQGRTPGKAKPCVQRALGARAEQCRGCGGLRGSRNHFGINSRGARPWLPSQSAVLLSPTP